MKLTGIACCVGLLICHGALASSPQYSAEVRRTSFGIPHVKANNEAGLGYGIGYAYAQDNFCMFQEAFLTVNGERSRYFGPDAVGGPDFDSGSINQSNLRSDFFFRLLNAPAEVDAAWRAQPVPVKALLRGYAAGFNRFLAEASKQPLPAECRDAPWVRKIDERDLIKFVRRLSVEGGALSNMKALLDAAPPVAGAVSATNVADAYEWVSWADRREFVGSNGVALGKEVTEHGRGILLGNPHYPWYGSLRFYQLHLTIPGKLDVMGASLGGFPVVHIGFNSQVAWTHTVNTSQHFTIRALRLDPSDATRYFVDGKAQRLRKQTVTVDVKDSTGAIVKRSHDFWISNYGPLLVRPGLAWSAQTAYALDDPNWNNDRLLRTWHAMNQSQSLDEFQEAITSQVGLPWVNTLAADRQGETLYTDVTVVPRLTQAKQDACIDAAHRDLMKTGLYVLNSTAACDLKPGSWRGSTGIFAGNELPVLRRTDYVQNSNDSAWLTNPAALLTGFAPVVSAQDYQQNDRTRIGISQIQARLAGTDGLPGKRFDARKLRQIAFNNRSYLGSLLRDDLLQICSDASPIVVGDNTVDAQQACAIIRGWDGYANVDSTGFPLARAWMVNLSRHNEIWATPFSASDPVNTPRGIKISDPAVLRTAREALANAVLELRTKGVDASRPWGEIQFIERNGRRIPVPGGAVYNAISGTMADGAVRVRAGSSYIQIVSFEADGPRAEALLTYSQSTDPASAHFADQAPLFAESKWQTLPFTDAQIERDPQYRSQIITQ
ncbi:penicillin acylase family protein [Steroidobacter sp.]|uniref:penicillin acylase family protein n=1 Tax=Steroidobacter sp. TaxID=1978227 RepID=UPI001A54B52D|nr:penicillin acylase family protein [Steroidobacter sp.]MBL8271729.1 penicillin acylase family protein [Steroidobacter sp.]